jgi:hypothetical protein
MKTTTLLEKEFQYDGKGPELDRVIRSHGGVILKGFEYYNPGKASKEDNIKHLKLIGVEAFSMAIEDVHGNILANESSPAAIFKVEDSAWAQQFDFTNLDNCNHYQIVFYNEIYDVLCTEIKSGEGRLLSDMQTVIEQKQVQQ